MWFGNKRKRLEMISAMRPTSKATLKMQCLMVCKGDIDEALKLYDFFAKDMPDLPDFDRPAPTWQQNTADTVNGVMNWLKDNGPSIQQAYQFVQQVIQNRGVIPPVTPDIEEAAEPLPEIN